MNFKKPRNKKVMHFGAGNIGRGFLGELYFDSGREVIYVDVYSKLVQILNESGKYPLWIIGEHVIKKEISNFSAIDMKDEKKILDNALNIDLISISVGANNLKNLAPVLAKIIKIRFREKPGDVLNIIICENMKNSALILSENIKKNMEESFRQKIDEKIGFVETVLSRMVPNISEKEKQENPLLVKVEKYNTLPVSKNSFKGEPPLINGFLFVDELRPYQDMKTYIHNFSHSSFAYIGHEKGYRFIWECASDIEIKKIVSEAVNEVIKAINKCYGITVEELSGYYEDLLKRFLNKELGDTVKRVTREPIRKLGKNERFIGTADFCLSQGITPEKICRVIPYVLNYFDTEDPEGVILKQYITQNSIDNVLKKICGLDTKDVVFTLIKNTWGENHL
ncbi:MAG: hypothetical protein M1501_03020 [Candidatus Omnitrophica bacterium]|nr:hypothetical protein [Candidatus Omnitrophota bacterium]